MIGKFINFRENSHPKESWCELEEEEMSEKEREEKDEEWKEEGSREEIEKKNKD